MCFSAGEADLTITSNDPNKTLKEKATEYGLQDQLPQDGVAGVTDPKVAEARAAELVRQMTDHGRSSTFLTGADGDPILPTLGKKKLYGG